ncbi:hypothetical protein LEP1GSC051_2605 [Leptospira sp. P2653]|nr:hypothetical protein LEP1GSC051_2605 [Leptospira sp. P2653]
MDCKNGFQMVRKEMRCFGSKKSIQTLLPLWVLVSRREVIPAFFRM